MKHPRSLIHSSAFWTIGTYALSLSLRLGSNVILSRLLSPELLGIMVVVSTVRLGIELLTDVGIEQNIVSNRSGDSGAFLNTAWTLQILRGLMLTGIFLAVSPTLAGFYQIDLSIFLVIAICPLISSLHSTSIFLLVRNLEVKKRNVFEISNETLAFCITVMLAWWWRDVWAIVVGVVISCAMRSISSYFLPHPHHKLVLVKDHVIAIFGFGKWIMISSLVNYAASNTDKIYLGKVIPLEALGMYGLARTISDLPAILTGRLAYQILFPFISASGDMDRSSLISTLAPARLKFLLLSCVAISIGIAWSDYAIMILYDQRYHDAGWMLCILLLGSWFGVLSGLNEVLLLGSEKPAYHSLAGGVRLAILVAGLTVGAAVFGLAGAICAIPLAEACRYVVLAFAQRRIKFSFVKQDGLASLLLFCLIFIWYSTREYLNLSQPWAGLFSSSL